MTILNYLLVKQSFWEQLLEEFEDVFSMFKDFFLMIKEVTYDVLAAQIGSDILNILLIMVAVVLIMFVCMAIINH